MNTATYLPTRADVSDSHKGARKKATNPNQLGLFATLDSLAEDILAGPRIAQIGDAIELCAANVLADNAELFTELEWNRNDKVIADNAEFLTELSADRRDNLNFALYMRSADIPSSDVREILGSVTPNPGRVMDELNVVESVLGTNEYAEVDETDEPGSLDQIDNEPIEIERMKASDSLGASTTSLYLASLHSSRYDPPTAEQAAALAVRIQAGDMSARDELVNRNMRFMVSQARRYIKTGRPLDDLIQAGSEGLITSAMKFNPELGRFTTIASFWIRQSIQRSVAEDANMPIPAYLPGQEAKLMRLAAAAPNAEEKAHLESRAEIAARNLESRRRTTVSLDSSSSGEEEGGDDLLSTLQSECIGQEERVAHMQIVSKLQQFATRLGDDRAKGIFMMRLGLHPEYVGESRTLAEISSVYDLTRERVRQIYFEAANDVATAMEYWAKGPENLPTGFRKGLLNPGKA